MKYEVVVAVVAAATFVTGCSASGSSEVVDKAYEWCRNQIPRDAANGELGDGSDDAEFARAVEEAFDDCVDLRIDYYKDHPEAP